MSSLSAKRPLDAAPQQPKRSRMVVLPRLCDMANGDDIFHNAHNSLKALEKGILRSRNASTKYEEVREYAPYKLMQACV